MGSALNDLSRELGGAFGIAVIGSVLTSAYRSHLHLPAQVPAALAGKARSSFGIAVKLGDPITNHAQRAFTDGIHLALLVGAGATIVAAIVVALALPREGH